MNYHLKKRKQPSFSRKELLAQEDLNLWLDYWYQLNFIKKTSPKSVLEIGKGSGVLELIMKDRGYKYVTADIDEKLKPDIIADITQLPFPDNSFDTVSAFEVLEHIPFTEFDKALREMKRVAKNNVVISLPYANFFVSIAMQFFYADFLKPVFSLLKLKHFEPNYINISIPFFFLRETGMAPNHRWEMGRRGYSVGRIKRIFKQERLEIVDELSRMFYPYHRFFLLKKISK